MAKILHIRLSSLQISHQNGMQESYYSLTYAQKHYFSSTFDDKSSKMQDDILIQLDKDSIPESISLQRWQNCMILFSFEIELTQLKSRTFTKKKLQTKHKEYLSLQFQLYDANDMVFSDKYNDSISQHYLIVQDLYFQHEKHQARQTNQPNYFAISTKEANYVLPLRQAVVLIKIPATIEIASFVNNVYNGKSSAISYEKVQNEQGISIDKDMKNTGKVALKVKWAINLHRCQVDQHLLMQTNELMFYDFQLKFDNPADIVGSKLKITHGSKAFDFTQDIDRGKITKIKKIVFFIIKSQIEEIDFTLHKLGKVLAYCRVTTSQISETSMTILKKKFCDPVNANKCFGFIKMRSQRSRNLSVPQSNSYWRQALRRKHVTNMIISVQQCSVYYSENQALTLAAKVQNDEKIISNLPNLNFYDAKDEPNSQIVEFTIKGEESLYLVVKADAKSNEFCGIGVVNTTQLRLGINVCEVPFYKNQQKTGILNCIINKMAFWPFMKPLFQSQTQIHAHHPMHIDFFFTTITFTPYFYTYRYDNKSQVYCIVQVNRTKKVLILDNTQHDKLTFFAAPGSDILNYQVQQPDVVKIKISFLVSDLGHEEEIYGTAVCKVKGSQLEQKSVKIKNVQIFNDYSVVLGTISLQASKGTVPKAEHVNKTAENHEKPSVGSSFDLSQASFDTNMLPQKSRTPARRYSGGVINSPKPTAQHYLKKNTGRHINDIKLPVIKEKKTKDSFQDLLHVMKVRKRQLGGGFEEKGHSSHKNTARGPPRERHSFDLKKLQSSNPNIDRNLQILFPKKANEKYIQLARSRHNDYEQRMKGLKSVMNQIADIGQVEPSLRESHPEGRYENQDFEEPEWQGNQFAQM